MHDTIFAHATAVRPAPQALLRISGPGCAALARKLLGCAFEAGAIDASIATTLGALPCRAWIMPMPGSFTGEDVLELRVCGNPRLAAALEARLLEMGARRAEAGEFTRRALSAGKLDLTRAQAVGALINAQSEAERRQALAELSGQSGRELGALTERLRALSAGYELCFDFSEDDPEAAPLGQLASELAALKRDLAEFCALASNRPRREVPVVALFGLPNAGKSSLFNALLGARRALVSELPGTTRDPVRAPLELGGHTIELRDLSGVGATDADLGRFAETARSEALSADVLLLLCAPGQREDFMRELDLLLVRDSDVIARALWVNTMCDRGQLPEPAPLGVEPFAASAVTGAGLNELRHAIATRLDATARGAATSMLRLRAGEALAALGSVDSRKPPEALALAARRALRLLDEALLSQAPGEVLDLIFSRFCIGK